MMTLRMRDPLGISKPDFHKESKNFVTAALLVLSPRERSDLVFTVYV